jgi:hypothetical protein
MRKGSAITDKQREREKVMKLHREIERRMKRDGRMKKERERKREKGHRESDYGKSMKTGGSFKTEARKESYAETGSQCTSVRLGPGLYHKTFYGRN